MLCPREEGSMARSAGWTGGWAVWVLLLAGPACVQTNARALLRRHAALWAGEANDAAHTEQACAEQGSAAQQRFVDFVRFESALERATRAVAALQTEGLVNSVQIALGARRAFSEAAQ